MGCLGFGCESWGAQVWAAWAQAILSVLAIAVALTVSWIGRHRQRKADQAAELLKARSVALMASASCNQIMADISEVLELQVAGTSTIFFGDAARRAAHVPESLRVLIPQLPLLGESGSLLQDLILVLQGIEAMQRSFDRQVAGRVHDLDDAFPFVGEQFALAMRLAEEAELRLDNLFDVCPLGALDLRQAIIANEHSSPRPSSASSLN
ncbi:hypothetical protein SAMN05428989_1145 [Pseudoxanthomonas sp. GM95]|uniref:hypothetical protein n=1 Tax=Pseudoxanthomonas sp. GM95 TaxID=1881043 RepID=UPI0008C46571|nr:hypothetical protein [Pseudoxanthomonas sp. GM95]SEK95616.1 hypothetical protein SAMN05428989_1145 [Pseudoxanthomonas sp. GM95]